MAFGKRRQGRGAALVAVIAGTWAASSFVPGVWTSRASSRDVTTAKALAGITDIKIENPALADAKERLLDLLDSNLEQEVLRPEGKPMRGRVDEAIIRLERMNSNEEPVYSPELDGTWTVKYAGSYAPGLLSSPTRELALFLYSGGFSLGNALSSFASGFWGQSLGVKLGSKKVEIIGGRDVDAFAEIEVAGQKETLRYKAELMPLSASRMSEEVVSLKLPDPIGNQDLPLELRRSILVTYLDEEMMIVRDESGVAEVLVKEMSAIAPKMEAEEATNVEVAGNSTNGTAPVVDAETEEDRALLDAAESEAS